MADLAARSASLADLRRVLATAAPSEMPALRSAVVAAVAATAIVTQSVTGISGKSSAELDARQKAASATIDRLVSDYYDRRVLDPYLRFDSAEEEEAFRKRERDRKEAIDRERAKGTPEGLSNAARLTLDQIRDAGAHGADRSPEYQPMLQAAAEVDAALRQPAREQTPQASEKSSSASAPEVDEMSAAMAALRAAGVQTSSVPVAGHGLAAKTIAKDDNSIGRPG